METCITLQLAYLFDEKISKIYRTLGKKGITFEFLIDIGKKGETNSYK